MREKLMVTVLCLVLLLSVATGWVAYAEEAAPGLRYWNSSTGTVTYEDRDRRLVFYGDGQPQVLAKDEAGMLTDFFISGDYVVYYGKNDSGKQKWFTFDMITGERKEYAYDSLDPFWADSEGVYTTTSGKRTYDYNIFRFNPKTGKQTKLASVYGMPVGYVGGRLIACDFYDKELRYYDGDKIAKKLDADMNFGFVVGDTVYLVFPGGICRVDGEDIIRVIDGYAYPHAFINDSALVYPPDDEYPYDVHLVRPDGIRTLGRAYDEAELLAIWDEAMELCAYGG